MQWLNRTGLILEFLSFWLVAPEILGEKWLKSAEHRLEKWIKAFPNIFLVVAYIPFIATFCAGWINPNREFQVQGLGEIDSILKGVFLIVFTLTDTATLFIQIIDGLPVLLQFFAGIAFLIIPVLFAVILSALTWHLTLPVLRYLADDRKIRNRSLKAGAVLFVVGTFLELIATF